MPDPKLAPFGLKYNPFTPAVPLEDVWEPPFAGSFFFRVETLARDGGFALLTGEPGLGKSKILQLLSGRLDRLGDAVVGVMERPQSTVTDFYREMGELFGVSLTPINRWGGFKSLRERWKAHIKGKRFRPVLLIDEAQEMETACLNEIRLLGSANFDSQCLLTTVLCGDTRLPDRFRTRALVPLGSRIRTRLAIEAWSREDLTDYLEHALARAGGAHLMSPELKCVVVDHAAGNPRVLTAIGAELLDAAIAQSRPGLDEQLFLELYSRRSGSRPVVN